MFSDLRLYVFYPQGHETEVVVEQFKYAKRAPRCKPVKERSRGSRKEMGEVRKKLSDSVPQAVEFVILEWNALASSRGFFVPSLMPLKSHGEISLNQAPACFIVKWVISVGDDYIQLWSKALEVLEQRKMSSTLRLEDIFRNTASPHNIYSLAHDVRIEPPTEMDTAIEEVRKNALSQTSSIQLRRGNPTSNLQLEHLKKQLQKLLSHKVSLEGKRKKLQEALITIEETNMADKIQQGICDCLYKEAKIHRCEEQLTRQIDLLQGTRVRLTKEEQKQRHQGASLLRIRLQKRAERLRSRSARHTATRKDTIEMAEIRLRKQKQKQNVLYVYEAWNRHVFECGGHLSYAQVPSEFNQYGLDGCKPKSLPVQIAVWIDQSGEDWKIVFDNAIHEMKSNRLFNGKQQLHTEQIAAWTPSLDYLFRNREHLKKELGINSYLNGDFNMYESR